MGKSKKIKVRITANQMFRYNKLIEVTQSEFDELKNSVNEYGESDRIGVLTDYLDHSDADDPRDFEDVEFEILKK